MKILFAVNDKKEINKKYIVKKNQTTLLDLGQLVFKFSLVHNKYTISIFTSHVAVVITDLVSDIKKNFKCHNPIFLMIEKQNQENLLLINKNIKNVSK